MAVGFPRKLMFSWWLWRRGLTLGVRAVVLDDERGVFLVKHSYVPGWHLPGGGVERGEDVLQALQRELQEEADITVLSVPRLHGVFHNGESFAGDHVVVFLVRDFLQGKADVSGFEIIDRGFFPVNDLPEATTRATRSRVAEALGEALPAARW